MAGEGEAMGVIARLPWWAKLGAKLFLARLPVPYGLWRRVGLFRHGEMNVPILAVKTFDAYYQRAASHATLKPGFRSLELGPGDSVLSGLVARAYGASHAWLVDSGAFADSDVSACLKTVELLRAQGKPVPDIESAGSVSEVLQRSGVEYLSEGTASLASIPDASVDFCWSQVVLEHVPRAEFPRFLQELRRIVAPGAVGVHSIDFRDHLGGGLNNLRFSQVTWEGRVFRGGGFYTNRIRPREMVVMFVKAGFDVELVSQTRWSLMPIRRDQLAREFHALSDEDFMVAEIEIVVRPKP
jgi:SAM-dependent methyltransferase